MGDPAGGAGPGLRPAAAGDQAAIDSLIRQVRINPTGLHWSRFVVADEDGVIVGCGQLKPHRDCVELASIAVRPERQGQGIGTAIVQALLARHNGTLYLTCRRERQGYYERFGFARIGWDELPGSFRPIYIAGSLISRLMARQNRITFMRRS